MFAPGGNSVRGKAFVTGPRNRMEPNKEKPTIRGGFGPDHSAGSRNAESDECDEKKSGGEATETGPGGANDLLGYGRERNRDRRSTRGHRGKHRDSGAAERAIRPESKDRDLQESENGARFQRATRTSSRLAGQRERPMRPSSRSNNRHVQRMADVASEAWWPPIRGACSTGLREVGNAFGIVRALRSRRE